MSGKSRKVSSSSSTTPQSHTTSDIAAASSSPFLIPQIQQPQSSKQSTVTVKSNAAMLDNVIKRRLLTDGDGVGDDRKIQGILKSLLTLCCSEEVNKTEDEAAFRKLIQSLRQLEYSARRTHAAIKMNEDTKQLYKSLDKMINEETVKTKETIKQAKVVIEEETKHRKHSMEYEALSKLIESKPNRKRTEKQKKTLEEDVQKLNEMKGELLNALQDRQKQVAALTHSVEMLREGIKEDEFKPWGSVLIAQEPTEDKNVTDMEVDSFPLEKEVFPSIDSSTNSKSKSEEVVANGSGTNGTNPSLLLKGKYEDLSEESPEEGESED